MRVTEPGAGEPVHHEVDEVVRQELVHACLLFSLVSYRSSTMVVMMMVKLKMVTSMVRRMTTAREGSNLYGKLTSVAVVGLLLILI